MLTEANPYTAELSNVFPPSLIKPHSIYLFYSNYVIMFYKYKFIFKSTQQLSVNEDNLKRKNMKNMVDYFLLQDNRILIHIRFRFYDYLKENKSL